MKYYVIHNTMSRGDERTWRLRMTVDDFRHQYIPSEANDFAGLCDLEEDLDLDALLAGSVEATGGMSDEGEIIAIGTTKQATAVVFVELLAEAGTTEKDEW